MQISQGQQHRYQQQIQYHKQQTQNHSEIIQAINDVNQISNYNCQWIDTQQSPHKSHLFNQSFPSDIQIGLDGINIGSKHHLEFNHFELNHHLELNKQEQNPDISIHNHQKQHHYQNDHQDQQYQFKQHQQSFIKTKRNNNNNEQILFDNSVLSNNSISFNNECHNNNGNMLGDELQLLDDSKQQNKKSKQLNQQNIQQKQQRNQINLFDQSDNLISQIQYLSNQQQKEQNNLTNNNNSNNKQQNNQNIQYIQNNQNKQSSIQLQSNQISNLKYSQQLQNNQQTNNQTFNQQFTNQQQVTNQQSSKSKSSIDKQQTIVINQNSFVSKIYDDLSSIQQSKLIKSMRNYLQTNQQTYNPFYSLLQAIYTNSKIKSQKSIQNFMMYSDFFKQKSKQYQKYLRELQSQKTQKLYQKMRTKQINNLVYIDTNIVLKDIHDRNIKKVKLYRIFYKQLLQSTTQIKKLITQIKQKRYQSQKIISNLLSVIKSLENDLQQLIQYRIYYQQHQSNPTLIINSKSLFHIDNTHILKDHYLQIKFIIEKQNTYIKKLKLLRTQIIKYITMIFLTDQIILSTKIKENIINYTEMLIQIEKLQRKSKLSSQQLSQKQNKQIDSDLNTLQNKKDTLSQKKIHEELKTQLARKLHQCIPQILRHQLGLNDFDLKTTSQELLQLLNSHFQNEVFFPNIQLEDQFIFYKAQGGWISRDEYKVLQMTNKNPSQIQSKNLLKFVLTINKYLHMQQNQKIATIKLNQIKISKKGKCIIISDRGKGIVGFLVNNGNQLGRIQLKTLQQADKFALKIKQLVEQK